VPAIADRDRVKKFPMTFSTPGPLALAMAGDYGDQKYCQWLIEDWQEECMDAVSSWLMNRSAGLYLCEARNLSPFHSKILSANFGHLST
jgi:hypothetical protein